MHKVALILVMIDKEVRLRNISSIHTSQDRQHTQHIGSSPRKAIACLQVSLLEEETCHKGEWVILIDLQYSKGVTAVWIAPYSCKI